MGICIARESTEDVRDSLPLPTGAPRPGTYTVRDEPSQGDCLFCALSRQMPELGDPASARHAVCEWLNDNIVPRPLSTSSTQGDTSTAVSDSHRAFIAQSYPELCIYDERSSAASDYVTQMRRSGEWGSGLEALGAAYLTRRPVWVWEGCVLGTPRVLAPPCAPREASPVGLLHVTGNHWQSVLVCLAAAVAGRAQAAAATGGARARCDEPTDDGPLWHGGSWLTEDAREARRQRNLLRFQPAAPEPPRACGPRFGARGTGAAQDRSGPLAAARAALERAGLSSEEAVKALEAHGGDLERVKALYGIGGDRTEAQGRPVSGPCNDVAELEAACAALQRVGFTLEEAAAAVQAEGGDLQKLKALYHLDWDQQRTVQDVFHTGH